eukprot:2961933-Prorocentrum_lima.AAC.1
MELSMVLTQIWEAGLPNTEKRRLCRFAAHAALGVVKTGLFDPVVQVQGVLDLLQDKLGHKMHPGEAARWLRTCGQTGVGLAK